MKGRLRRDEGFSTRPARARRKYFLPFSHTFLPIWSLWAVGLTTPFIELIAGALLLFGLGTRCVYRSRHGPRHRQIRPSFARRALRLKRPRHSAPRCAPLCLCFRAKMTASRSITSIRRSGCKKRSNVDNMLRARTRQESDLET